MLKGRPSLGCTSTREGATSALELCSTFLYPVLIDLGRRRGWGEVLRDSYKREERGALIPHPICTSKICRPS